MRRRTMAWLTALALVHPLPVRAQDVPPVFRTNFAIPDSPAYELLGLQPSTILRPQTPRDLALAFSNFLGRDGGFIVPRAFAIEVSPALLIQGAGMTQERYRDHRLLAATRLSLATVRTEADGGPARLAVGVRLTLADDAGHGTDQDFPAALRVQPAIDSIHGIRAQARRRAVQAPENRERRPNEITAVLDPGERAEVEALSRRIARIWADRYWNANRWDFAFAARVQTADSLGHDPALDALSLWTSWARGIATWGQLLAGARAGASRSAPGAVLKGDASTSARFYAGTNRAKAFLEGQLAVRAGREPAAFLNSGCELAVLEGIWLDVHAGLERLPGGGSRLTTGFKLKTSAWPS